jgi:hypothetical protein
LEGVRRLAASFPISGMVMAGAVVLGGTSPALVAPVLEGTTAGRWIGRLFPAVRMVCEPSNTTREGDAWVRVPLAERGHDLQWLVDTGEDLDADLVARTVGRQIGAMVSGTPVNALHLDTEVLTDMVAVRTSTDRAAALRSMVATGGHLIVAGRRCAVYPLTVVRTGGPRLGVGARQTDRLAEAAESMPPSAWAHAARHGPVLRRVPVTEHDGDALVTVHEAVELGMSRV